MRALVVDRTGLSVQTLPDPVPGPYEVVCRMLYGSVCSGTDTHVVQGTFQEEDVEYPSIIGHESIGEVIEVGPNVENFAVGDHITRVSAQQSTAGVALSWGGMCELGVAGDHVAMRQAGLPESSWADYQVNEVVPPGLLHAAEEPMIITWRETYDYMRRIGAGAGRRVVVSGSGANGLSLAAMAGAMGSEVTVIGSASRRDETERIGARPVDYRDADAVRDLVDREADTFSILVDATGKSDSISHLLPLLGAGGAVGVYGMDDLRSYQIQPMRGPSSFSFYNGGYNEPDAHGPVMKLLRDGRLHASVWIRRDAVFDWHNIQDAYIAAENRSLIKPVIRLSAEKNDGERRDG